MILEEDATFSKAVGSLTTSPLIAPCYITVAGISREEGVVITRNRDSEENLKNLKDGNILQVQLALINLI